MAAGHLPSRPALRLNTTTTTTVLGNRLRQFLVGTGVGVLVCLMVMAQAPAMASAAAVPGPPAEATTTIDLEAKPRLNPSVQAIRESGYLRIGLGHPDNLPLYGHDKDGNPIGYDVDLAMGIANALNVKPVFSQPKVSYTRLVQLASADQIDLALGKLSVTIPRLGYAQPVPYMNLHQSLLINRQVLDAISQDTANIGPKLRATPIRVGVINNSSYSVWGSTTLPKARFTTYPDWPSCIEALTNGEVDAVFRDSFETARLVKSNPSLALDYVPIILKDKVDNIAMYVGPRMEGLKPIADLYINITTGVVDEADLFRLFRQEMKRAPIALNKLSKPRSRSSD